MARILVIGAGPAGSVFSARMAQLGHDVCLIERAMFPRSRLGESLSPGALPLLDMIGGRIDIERAGFRRVRSVSVNWDGQLEQRNDPEQRGLVVDRGHFDSLLLERARALGVQVLQPASVHGRRRHQNRWVVHLDKVDGSCEREVDFIADASGRTGLSGRRRRASVRTIALHAYWRGSSLPEQPRIEAGRDAWYWGVPLPDGRYNTLAFLDPKRVREERGRPIAGIFHRHLDGSGIMAGCRDLRLDGPVRAVDATPYVDEESVTPFAIKVGDAALAIDPLSSSGVQKAVQTALAGAIVANTLIRKPESQDAAMRFYGDALEQASARHRAWAGAHYASVARRLGGMFWKERAVEDSTDLRPAPEQPDSLRTSGTLIEVSPLLDFVELPCIHDEFVTTKVVVRHPQLDSPLAFLGGWELAPLLKGVRAGMTLGDAVRSWSDRVPVNVGAAIAGWLLDHHLLVAQTNTSHFSSPPSTPAVTTRCRRADSTPPRKG